MLGLLILLVLQLMGGWAIGLLALHRIPSQGSLDIFVHAAIFAAVVWVIGIIGALVLKGVSRPSVGTLVYALIGALIGAGLTLSPDIVRSVGGIVRGLPRDAYPLVGAVLGYLVRR
jgi:hypothetical protein